VEDKAKISLALKGNTNSPSITVTVLDLETNITTIYPSIRQAAAALNSDLKTLRDLSKRQNPDKPYRDRYIITIHNSRI